MAHKLNFKPGTQRNRKLKAAPDKYKLSDGRPNISMSDGIAPAFPLAPDKNLPTAFQDINTQDYVVIPKGRIVSCKVPNVDTSVNTGHVGADGTAITYHSDESYYGINRAIKGLLVPANGGGDVWYKYDSVDQSVVPGATDGSMAADGDYYVNSANAPIGCMEHDVYQDIRGANLNYDMRNKNWGVLSSQLIKIPAVNIQELEEFLGATAGFSLSGSAPVATDLLNGGSLGTYWGTSAWGGYKKASEKYAFLSFRNGDAGVAGTTGTDGYGGQLLQADAFGNWKPQAAMDTGGTAGGVDTGGSVIARNEQTAGRLLGLDSRFEKDMLDVVQGPYDQKVAGSQTLGIPDFLYGFAKDALNGSGVNWAGTYSGTAFSGKDEAYLIKAAVDAGCFSYAWIQLNIR